jgi:hypothetical protein
VGFVVSGSKPSVGLDLAGAVAVAAFECGAKVGGEAVTLEGSVIAPLTPIDKMSSSFALKYKALGGYQAPEAFESGVKDTLTMSVLMGLERSSEQTGLTAAATLASEEPVEVKAKV